MFIVLVKLLSSVLQTTVIWYTLNNSSANILLSSHVHLHTRSTVTFINSLLYRAVDSLLLLTMFLMSCGWQITHQLIVVRSCYDLLCQGEGNPVRLVHLRGTHAPQLRVVVL